MSCYAWTKRCCARILNLDSSEQRLCPCASATSTAALPIDFRLCVCSQGFSSYSLHLEGSEDDQSDCGLEPHAPFLDGTDSNLDVSLASAGISLDRLDYHGHRDHTLEGEAACCLLPPMAQLLRVSPLEGSRSGAGHGKKSVYWQVRHHCLVTALPLALSSFSVSW